MSSMASPNTPPPPDPHGSDSEFSDGDMLACELDLLSEPPTVKRRLRQKSPVGVAASISSATWMIN